MLRLVGKDRKILEEKAVCCIDFFFLWGKYCVEKLTLHLLEYGIKENKFW